MAIKDRVETALAVLQHVFDSMDTATLVRNADGAGHRLDELAVMRRHTPDSYRQDVLKDGVSAIALAAVLA